MNKLIKAMITAPLTASISLCLITGTAYSSGRTHPSSYDGDDITVTQGRSLNSQMGEYDAGYDRIVEHITRMLRNSQDRDDISSMPAPTQNRPRNSAPQNSPSKTDDNSTGQLANLLAGLFEHSSAEVSEPVSQKTTPVITPTSTKPHSSEVVEQEPGNPTKSQDRCSTSNTMTPAAQPMCDCMTVDGSGTNVPTTADADCNVNVAGTVNVELINTKIGCGKTFDMQASSKLIGEGLVDLSAKGSKMIFRSSSSLITYGELLNRVRYTEKQNLESFKDKVNSLSASTVDQDHLWFMVRSEPPCVGKNVKFKFRPEGKLYTWEQIQPALYSQNCCGIGTSDPILTNIVRGKIEIKPDGKDSVFKLTSEDTLVTGYFGFVNQTTIKEPTVITNGNFIAQETISCDLIPLGPVVINGGDVTLNIPGHYLSKSLNPGRDDVLKAMHDSYIQVGNCCAKGHVKFDGENVEESGDHTYVKLLPAIDVIVANGQLDFVAKRLDGGVPAASEFVTQCDVGVMIGAKEATITTEENALLDVSTGTIFGNITKKANQGSCCDKQH